MNPILIKSESRFSINRKRIKKKIRKILEKQGVVSKIEISVAFIGIRKMARLNRDFRGKNEATSVLSFSQTEKRAGERFIGPPNDILYLGDVVICYPLAQHLANKEQILVDEEIDRLVEHGLLNLLRVNS